MVVDADVLAPRWRRLDEKMEAVRAALSIEAPLTEDASPDEAERQAPLAEMSQASSLINELRALERLTAARHAVQAGPMSVAVPDALDALYALWERWSDEAGLTLQREDEAVEGDHGGETTAALVFARGGQTHQGLNFGQELGYGLGAYGEGPYGVSGWRWQPYADSNKRYAKRSEWYRTRLEWQEVLPTLEEAVRWLRAQPELAVPPAEA